MELFKDRVICPRCDGNGLIYRAKIEGINEFVFLCDECEACWLKSDDIDDGVFIDFSTFLEGKNLSYRTAKVIDLGYEWYKNN